jgi:hypothetical protein
MKRTTYAYVLIAFVVAVTGLESPAARSVATIPPEPTSTTVPLTTVPVTTVTTVTTVTPATTVPATTVLPTTVLPTTVLPTTVPGPINYDDPSLAPVCGVIPDSTHAGCRLIAFYGTPLSTRLGPLGATPPDQMLAALKGQTARWQAADPATPTKCAFDLITVIVQGSPGKSGLYRNRTAPEVIEKTLKLARSAGCILILDLQVGWSNVPDELPPLLPFLAQPDVHLALDPEWDMPPGVKPGSQIGTMTAADINVAVDTLHRLVIENKLPPKLLVVHRFRPFMVTDPSTINVAATVRLVANMDGFGPPAQKINGYSVARAGMPTKLGGFKLFFKLDRPLLEPKNLVPTGVVNPAPVFINYQ